MKKILIILITLSALSVLGWNGVYQIKAPTIQADIQQRVSEALTSNSLDWVNYEVDGRDVILNGTANNQKMAQHAFDTADIYGLNRLTSNILIGNTTDAQLIQAEVAVAPVLGVDSATAVSVTKVSVALAEIKGIASSQDESGAAEALVQEIAGDLIIDTNIAIAETPPNNVVPKITEDLPLVGSDKYATKFCQAEFNGLLKQQKIVFQSGSSDLQGTSAVLLDKIAVIAARCSKQGIQVHGYTDSAGAAQANWTLSQLRAESVASYLAQKGVEKSRLVAIGHGEKNPIASNKTKKGRAKNRRIKLIVKRVK